MSAQLMAELVHRTSLHGSFDARTIITRSGKRRRGSIPSRFGLLDWEAPLERNALYRLTASWSCTALIPQPVQWVIPCRYGDSFRYTPDAATQLCCGFIAALECKREKDLDEEMRRRLRAVLAYLSRLGIAFKVLTERDLPDSSRQANAELLSKHYQAELKPAHVQALHALTRSSPSETFGQLVQRLGLQQARTALARGFLFFDTAEPLVDDTPLFDTFHESHDAADFLYT